MIIVFLFYFFHICIIVYRTVSIAWITPFEAAISASTTLAAVLVPSSFTETTWCENKCVNISKFILNYRLTLMTPLLNTWVATVSPPAVSVSPHMIPFLFWFIFCIFFVYFLYLWKQNIATDPVSQENLGQGLLVGQQSRKSISGDLRRKFWLVNDVKLV